MQVFWAYLEPTLTFLSLLAHALNAAKPAAPTPLELNHGQVGPQQTGQCCSPLPQPTANFPLGFVAIALRRQQAPMVLHFRCNITLQDIVYKLLYLLE